MMARRWGKFPGDAADLFQSFPGARLRGFLETEFIVYRTVGSDDPIGLGISISADDMPSAMEGTS